MEKLRDMIAGAAVFFSPPQKNYIKYETLVNGIVR